MGLWMLDVFCLQLPLKSRGQAWASFDGKARQRLSGGDALIVRMSAWPVPTVCDEESSGDFLRSVREGLHWNLRVCQLSDGPQQISWKSVNKMPNPVYVVYY